MARDPLTGIIDALIENPLYEDPLFKDLVTKSRDPGMILKTGLRGDGKKYKKLVKYNARLFDSLVNKHITDYIPREVSKLVESLVPLDPREVISIEPGRITFDPVQYSPFGNNTISLPGVAVSVLPSSIPML